ncbi:MAG: SDR family oxidoreductase [Robiginitomaculum sp.]|nr:SDR family oxidoreductase [Robiginitomaculum sp.]
MARKLCLITGASAGIGAALAREYAANGWDLALTARREDRLKELADELKDKYGVECLTIAADLAKKSAPKAIVKAIKDAGRQIDGLINNAGYGLPGTYNQPSWKDHEQFLTVMLTAPLELCYLVLPEMQKRKFGRIINVASLAGHLPGTNGHTLYGADKSFLIKFSQSLNVENLRHGVHVNALCPGFTFSEFHDVNSTRKMVSKMPNYMWESAERVAKEGYAAVERNDPVHITGKVNNFLALLIRILPEAVGMAMMNSQSKNFRAEKAK